MAADPTAARDARRMRRALALAARGRGRVEPNPMVGCVIGREETILGEGYHEWFGGPHAEVAAIEACRAAGDDPAGATAWVTLEPCAHHGKTPPCATALVEAGLARVVVATGDPFPATDGRGLTELRAAGIEVVVGPGAGAARRLNAPFFKREATGLPWVILKWAQTLDGRIATRTGDSRWISGKPARRLVHRWRGEVDAVMVGIGTALADDPQLTARQMKPKRVARRVVVDRDLRLPPSSALMASLADGGPPVTIATGESAAAGARAGPLRERGAEIIVLPPDGSRPGHLDLSVLMRRLAADHDATNVLVEGGAGLGGALLAAGLVDELRVFTAPKLLGDAAGVPAVRGLAPGAIDEAMGLTLASVRRVGDDVLTVWRPAVADGSPAGEG